MRPYRSQPIQKLTIGEISPGHFIVKGNLTFASIDKDILKSFGFLTSKKIIDIDLSQVNTTDSAGLALMIEWLKYSKKNNIKLRFENIPAQLQALAKLSGFDQNITNTPVEDASKPVAT